MSKDLPRRSLLRCGAAAAASALLAPVVAANATPLRVVASFSILADLAREVGGDAVDVRSLVPPGADAHVYSPSPADARAVAQADLLIVNGLRFEGWMNRLIRAVGFKGPVLVATRGITPLQTAGGPDPHAWHSLANVRVYVENIRQALTAQRPGDAGTLQARANAYLQRLDAVERATIARLERIPRERRRVVTDHQAFGYFAAAYGVDFIAPRGWSTESEPSAEAVARIVRQLRAQRGGALLLEHRADPRLLERIAAEAGITVGGRLYADALSAPGGEADSYLKLFEHNVETLVGALARPTDR